VDRDGPTCRRATWMTSISTPRTSRHQPHELERRRDDEWLRAGRAALTDADRAPTTPRAGKGDERAPVDAGDEPSPCTRPLEEGEGRSGRTCSIRTPSTRARLLLLMETLLEVRASRPISARIAACSAPSTHQLRVRAVVPVGLVAIRCARAYVALSWPWSDRRAGEARVMFANATC